MRKVKFLPLTNALIIAFFILMICTLTLTHHALHPTKALDSGWNVTINDKSFENVTLSEFHKILDKKMVLGDHIVMSTVLPDIGYLPSPTIAFKSRYTTLDCFFDGKQIYSFGHDFYRENKFLGKLYHMITLNTDYAGKILVFDMYVAENDPFSELEPAILGTHQDIGGLLVHNNLLIIATGVFMFVFGVAFLCMGLLFVARVPEVKSLLFGALFSINLGAWLLSYYNVLSFFVYTPRETQVEYFSLYVIIPHCFLILYYVLGLKGDRTYLAFAATCCSVPLLQFILHYSFNIHMRDTITLYHIDGVIGFGILIYYAIKNAKKENVDSAAMVQISGIMFFACALFVHFILYYLSALHIRLDTIFDKLVITVGCLLFVMCQIATYMVFITDNYAKKEENISLSHLAYADGLTNLANRAKAEKYMDELDASDNDYCMISIDLNGLKIINDKFGHPTGDKYIKDFAKVLTNTFGELGLCARVGGDEFLVVMENCGAQDIDGLINRMNSALNVMNALYTEYQRSVSTGYAFRHEFNTPNAHKVYMRADKRMYDEKRKMHEALGIHTRL